MPTKAELEAQIAQLKEEIRELELELTDACEREAEKNERLRADEKQLAQLKEEIKWFELDVAASIKQKAEDLETITALKKELRAEKRATRALEVAVSFASAACGVNLPPVTPR